MLEQVESILSELGEIDINFQFLDEGNYLGRRIFHLTGMPTWNKVEVAVASLSKAYVYTKGLDSSVEILINKDNTVKFQQLNKADLNKNTREKLNYLKNLFLVHKAETEKYCLRNKFLEAYQYYENFALQPLVGSLRAVYSPTKQGFYLKHLYQDLPEDTSKGLESFYKIRSVDDIYATLDKIEQTLNNLS